MAGIDALAATVLRPVVWLAGATAGFTLAVLLSVLPAARRRICPLWTAKERAPADAAPLGVPARPGS